MKDDYRDQIITEMNQIVRQIEDYKGIVNIIDEVDIQSRFELYGEMDLCVFKLKRHFAKLWDLI